MLVFSSFVFWFFVRIHFSIYLEFFEFVYFFNRIDRSKSLFPEIHQYFENRHSMFFIQITKNKHNEHVKTSFRTYSTHSVFQKRVRLNIKKIFLKKLKKNYFNLIECNSCIHLTQITTKQKKKTWILEKEPFKCWLKAELCVSKKLLNVFRYCRIGFYD